MNSIVSIFIFAGLLFLFDISLYLVFKHQEKKQAKMFNAQDDHDGENDSMEEEEEENE
jgi:hypothetical protein